MTPDVHSEDEEERRLEKLLDEVDTEARKRTEALWEFLALLSFSALFDRRPYITSDIRSFVTQVTLLFHRWSLLDSIYGKKRYIYRSVKPSPQWDIFIIQLISSSFLTRAYRAMHSLNAARPFGSLVLENAYLVSLTDTDEMTACHCLLPKMACR